MTQKPVVCFFLYDKDRPIHSGKEEWNHPLPLGRQEDKSSRPSRTISYGDYFKAVQSCLEYEAYEMVLYAIFLVTKEKSDIAHLKEINITIIKHGEYYHPSRIDITCHQQSFSFVMNVAVSVAGIRAIKKEFGMLDDLSGKVPNGYLPTVYGFGESTIGENGPVSMFMGEWFEGYHEFHVTHDPDGNFPICVWDTEQGHQLVSDETAHSLYMKISEILTIYYDISTCRQVFPWHHAAGDFIVRIDDGDVGVRLITVRQYAAMVEIREEYPEVYLAALLLFLLNLTLRIRLDRVDGVAEMAWLDDFVLDAAFQGFLNGLAYHEREGTGPVDLTVSFKAFVKEIGLAVVTDMMMDLVSSYDHKASEVSLINGGLRDHMEKLAMLLIENGFL